ncbi:MAG TPA: OsmC family protein, partial [Polyangia bacterium]|nr:OsmC family protein [Polyangia bacterium]
LDLMVVSVAACAHYFAAAYLQARGLPTTGVTVEIDSDKDRVPVSRIARLSMKVHVPASLDQRHLAGIERAIKACPAYGTLLHPPTVQIVIQPGDAAAEGASKRLVG